MKNTIYYSLVALFLFLSCGQERKQEESNTIAVDLERRDAISCKELFAEIQLVPLETSSESLIRQMTQLRLYEDRYYVHDYSRASILVFDSDGAYLWSLSKRGAGPGEYLNLTSFDIDPVRKNLVVLCAVSNALFFYDMEGNFIEKRTLPDINGAYNAFQFQNEDTIAFFTYDYANRLKFYSLSSNEIFNECFPYDNRDRFGRNAFPFPQAFSRALINPVYSLAGATLSELYRWDFGALNNNLERLEEFPSGKDREKQIQYIKDVYASRSVQYVIDFQGQNDRYRYAMLIRKNQYIHLFYDRRKQKLSQFEQTREGMRLYPVYFGEAFMLCTPEEGFPIDELFPKELRSEEQQRMIESHSEEDNPILIKYVFRDGE